MRHRLRHVAPALLMGLLFARGGGGCPDGRVYCSLQNSKEVVLLRGGFRYCEPAEHSYKTARSPSAFLNFFRSDSIFSQMITAD